MGVGDEKEGGPWGEKGGEIYGVRWEITVEEDEAASGACLM